MTCVPDAVTVLVVGGGPTGILMAAEIHRRGVDCLLIDAHDSPMEWDRATVVHPRSLEIFDSLNIVEPFLASGVKQRWTRIHANGGVLGEINLELCGSRYPFNIGISEEKTEAILTDYLAGQGGEITRGTKLVALEETPNGVLATIERAGGAATVLAQWVIGCDGHHSTVRMLADIKQNGHEIAEPWAVFDARVSGWRDSLEANYAYLDRVPVILTALPEERWRVYLRPSSPDSDLVADALSTVRCYLPEGRFEDVTHPTRFHCRTKVAQRFRSGRILLAGDAAHTCSPAQGHGMNSGLQDAFNLAWKLALVCQGQCSDALLDSYHAERCPVADTIMASGDVADQSQMIIGTKERRARDEAIRMALADPVSRHHEAVAEAELNIDYAASPIVMGQQSGAIWPGQRLPDQIEIRSTAGEREMLHHHSHRRGHAAFLIAGVSTTDAELMHIAREIEHLSDGVIIEAIMTLSANSRMPSTDIYLTPEAAGTLGMEDITLIVVRPDGHVGLCTQTNHAQNFVTYIAQLRSAHRESGRGVNSDQVVPTASACLDDTRLVT